MKAYSASASGRKAGRAQVAQWRRWLRECDEVSVYAEGLGFVAVSKKTAGKLIHKKGAALVARYTPELGLLFLEPCPF